MSIVSITTNNIVVKQTADMNTDTELISRTNDQVNYNNRKVSATKSDQINTSVVINSSNVNKNTQHACKSNQKCQPPNRSVTKTTTTTNNEMDLTRTSTRNSCTSVYGQNIAKSWYARCNRWRSRSCDRRKTTTIRYSWNTNANRPE